MGYLRKTFKKNGKRARKKVDNYLSKLKINFPSYNIDISSKIPDKLVLGGNPEKGTRGEQIDLSRLKGMALNEVKKRLDIEKLLRKKFTQKIDQIKSTAPEYLETHLLTISKDYDNIKERCESARETLSSIREAVLKILVIINTIKAAINILDKIASTIFNITNPIEKILNIAEKILNAPVFVGEPGTLRTNLFNKIRTLRGKINSTKKDIDNYLHPKQIKYINTRMAKVINIINNIIDDINFLLEKIAMLLALLEYLYLIILKIIAIKQAESNSNSGAGVDGEVIKDTIQSASSTEELLNILENINPNNTTDGGVGVYGKIIERIMTINDQQIEYTTKAGMSKKNNSINRRIY
jgi:methyl-accepting chemotaxis protein